VNAHAHLDLGNSVAVPDQGSFPDWLLGVGRARGAAGDVTAAAAEQAAALAGRGVVAIGDIDANLGAATRGRRRIGIAGPSYLEIVGVAAASARARLAEALSAIDRLGGHVGLSPHAPYSVAAVVVPEIVRAAGRRELPLAMHLAESTEETRYLTHGDGPFVGFLETIGRGQPFEQAPGMRPIRWADRLGLLAAGCVVIHGNDVDDDDVGLLARHGTCVVYCHGTHRHFDRPAHRLLELIEAGVEVALGTDSGVSNDGVDLLAEMCRLAADRPDIPRLTILRCATVSGRRALGMDPGAAAFEPGSDADGLLLGALPGDIETWQPEQLADWALQGTPSVLATLARGHLQRGEDATPGLLDTLNDQG
jgi:cytosine/adenosine deaminase-related metal-dependent hydrolase